MKLAILSDVHGNLEALTQVLADVDACGVDAIHTLGDNIGYGPDPQAVLDELAARGVDSIMGNHELGLVEPKWMNWFNPQARAALERTAELLRPGAVEGLFGLPRFRVVRGLRLVHGLPPASPSMYLWQASDKRLRTVMADLPEEISLVGHTHELALVRLQDGELKRLPLNPGGNRLAEGARWLVNIGSVGMPRDGDPRAKYALVDPEARELELRRVAYDAGPTKAKIIARGINPIYAERLG